MKCPFCHVDNDRVADSRASQDGYVIRRRRECLHCRRRYTTFERLEQVAVKVVKKDGSRVPFDREKIRRGVDIACSKRPISDEQIDGIVTHVEQHINARLDGEIDSRQIGEMVMERLRALDHVAYVRFASVYHDFSVADDFMREVAPMLDAPSRLPPPPPVSDAHVDSC
jgi:transcriptional repressor NrdR